MTDLADGESHFMKGSGAKPYELKNTHGVYSCTCPAWRNQSIAIDVRTCKHLRTLRGAEAEAARVGAPAPKAASAPKTGDLAGEPAAGPGLLLAHPWDGAQDPTGWWLSEKLDGVRAYWDGTGLVSRQGNAFYPPDWFRAALPALPLDGELWIGRKLFQRTVSVVRSQGAGEAWREVRFLVFDAPRAPGGFEERQAALHASVTASPHVEVLAHARCDGVDHLHAELARVEGLGGEGLMLREAGSRYEAGRSTTLLKVKRFLDAEAVVVGHQAGAGRHKGRLGALVVALADGTAFHVGTGFSDRERATPPAIGATITFKYQELSDGGVPRFPTFVRVRPEGG